jgi:RNA polymerase sigma-70 factor (ECF subfamily)
VSGESDDRQLIALAANGDQQAFARLVQRHQDRIFNLAYRYTRDRQDAEELTQEIFFRAWRHAGSFRGDAAFATWLYRLGINVCLNQRQRKKTRPDHLPLSAEHAADGALAGAELLASERELRLKSAMDALPARQRLALVLASFEEQSYEEIAVVMEVSVASVESLLFRARRNLAAILKPLQRKGEL